MKMNGLIFVLGFLLAFGAGYLFLGNSGGNEAQDAPAPQVTEDSSPEGSASEGTNDSNADQEEVGGSVEADMTLDADVEALSRNNCLSCHAVEAAGLDGGTTGPDLSNAYEQVEGKHGKPIEEFLQEPTSAVMSTVIEDNPLDDAEREKIVELLKEVSELND